jgi:hypothetical protein
VGFVALLSFLVALATRTAATERCDQLCLQSFDEGEVMGLPIEDDSFELVIVVAFDRVAISGALVSCVKLPHKRHLKFEMLVARHEENGSVKCEDGHIVLFLFRILYNLTVVQAIQR